MTKKFHFAVMLLLIAALPLSIFAMEKENPKAIEATTAPIDCPKATIAYKNQSFCISDTLQAVDLQGTGNYTGGTFSTTPGLNINTQTGTITPNSSSPGNYTVTYTIPASGNCPATTATTSVTINPILTPTVNCGISTTTSVQFTWKNVTGATGYSVSYQVNSNQVVNVGAIGNVLTYSVSGLIAGDVVTMTVAPTGGTCYASGTQTCTTVPCVHPVLTLSSDKGTNAQNICINTAITPIEYTLIEGMPTATNVTLTAGALPTGVTGSFSAGKFTITGTPSTSGTFNYTLTTTGGCITATVTGSITVNPNPTITGTLSTCIAATSQLTGSATASATTPWTSSNTAVATISNTGLVYAVSAGTTTITYRNTNGCSQTATFTVNPRTTIASKTATICSGTAFTVTPTNTAPDVVPAGITYTWTAPAIAPAGAITGGSAQVTGVASISQTLTNTTNAAATATYNVTASSGTSSNMCSSTFTVTVTVNPKLNPLLTPTINCGTSSTTSVVFNWAAVAGATGYYVSYQVNSNQVVNIGAIGNVLTYSVNSLNAGDSVTMTVTPTGGTCYDSGTLTCTALNCFYPTAFISYTGTPFCSNDTVTKSVTLIGTGGYTGGTYTASPSGLIINASTGAITPNNSTAGTYTVTYTTPFVTGCSQVTATTTVVITPLPTAAISYTGAPFCKSLTTAQAVTLNGTGTYTGGAYTTSPSGLSINATTGAITPSKSTAGTYTVTYTTPANAGCSAVTSTTIVEIKDDTSLLNISTNKTEICENGAVTYSVTEDNPLPNTVYSWDLNGKYMGDGNSKVINIKENDIVTCSSSKKCVNTTAPSVKIIKKTNTPVSIVDASTANNTYVVSGVCDACSGDATYKWSKGNQTVSNTKEYNYNNLNNGDIVKLTITDVTNCLLGETTMIVTIKRNTISGKVLYNTGNDDCATGVPYQNKAVIAKQNSYTYTCYTNKTGDYEINIPEGNYTLNVYKDANDPTTITPQNVAVVVQGANNNYINNFCLSNNSNENDIAVSMYPLNSARPGFEAKYVMYLLNKGYSYVSGTFTLKYDPTKMNFTSATPTIASNTNGILTWNYNNLAPGAALEINLVMTIITPPTVNSGTVLNYVLTGNLTLTDKNPLDNVYNYNQTVVNSYDPNDKIVVEGAYINESQATDYLHYITRFQNTGTASAINVVVKETLDSNLDWSTFEPEGSSHTGNIELKLGDQLTATFLNINLEDSTTNEPASHGWIAYKIKPKPGFAIGDVAFAKSDIYFDFNAPIITNTVSTQIQLLSNPDFENSTIQLYPNPVTDSFSINTNQEISNITVFDLNGRAVCVTKNQNNINIAALTTGLYIVEVKTINGIFRKKLIKN